MRKLFLLLMAFVAVPINFGMLSYKMSIYLPKKLWVAVPINFGMLSYKAGTYRLVVTDGRSPHQFWNALLHSKSCLAQRGNNVAVPINFGMLSYTHFMQRAWVGNRRSPHQFWNALLQIYNSAKKNR